jgi:hypothetical protein
MTGVRTCGCGFLLFLVATCVHAGTSVYTLAVGSVLSVNADVLADTNAFAKPPRVYLLNGTQKLRAKVINARKEFPRTNVWCRWTKPFTPGYYPLMLERNEPHAEAERVPAISSVRAPALAVVSPMQGAPGTLVTLHGMWFGTTPKRIWLQLANGKQYKCTAKKPYPFADWRGRAGKSCMNPTNGISSLTFAVPRGTPTNQDCVLHLLSATSEDWCSFQTTNLCTLRVLISPVYAGFTMPSATVAHEIARGVPINIIGLQETGFYFSEWIVSNGVATVEQPLQAITRLTATSDCLVIARFSTNAP